MSSISAIQSFINGYDTSTAKTRQSTPAAATGSSSNASSVVSISDAAREAAKTDQPGFKLPEYMTKWFNKDFPQDVIDEAKARLDDIKNYGALGASTPANLPLLPENQKLQDDFRREMQDIRSVGAGNETPAQSERFNQLLNLSMRLQLVGGQKPMSEADVQRELDVSAAMAKLAPNTPAKFGQNQAEQPIEQTIADIQSGKVPANWRQHWESENLTMPTDVTLSQDRSMWLDIAKAAGIGEDEFLTKFRELAGTGLKNHALTHAVESFISQRYMAIMPVDESQSTADTATAAA